ncbi:hypothetical protein FI667_g6664, partial [Globisporangium splendens]
MVKPFCALVGAQGSSFPVSIGASELVGDLRQAIRKSKKSSLKMIDADGLDLYLVKRSDGENSTCLRDDDEAATERKYGAVTKDIETIVNNEEQTKDAKSLQYWLFERCKIPKPTSDEIHVLMMVPTQPEEWSIRSIYWRAPKPLVSRVWDSVGFSESLES